MHFDLYYLKKTNVVLVLFLKSYTGAAMELGDM